MNSITKCMRLHTMSHYRLLSFTGMYDFYLENNILVTNVWPNPDSFDIVGYITAWTIHINNT